MDSEKYNMRCFTCFGSFLGSDAELHCDNCKEEQRIKEDHIKAGKGTFTLKKDFKIPTNVTMYECADCVKNAIPHEIKEERRGSTGNSSCWGSGIPVYYNFCTGCKRETGGWVKTDHVGGGY